MGTYRDTCKATLARKEAFAARLEVALKAIRRIDSHVEKSASEVARLLNSQGVPTRRGGASKWSAQAVLDVRPLLGKGYRMPHHERAAREKSREQDKKDAERKADLTKCPLDARLSKRIHHGGRLVYILEDGTAWYATGRDRGKPLTGPKRGRAERERSRRRYTEKLKREDKLEERLVPLRMKPKSKPLPRQRVKARSELSLEVERIARTVAEKRRADRSSPQAPAITAQHREAVTRMHEAEKDYGKIARNLGLSRATVFRLLMEAGVIPKTSRVRPAPPVALDGEKGA